MNEFITKSSVQTKKIGALLAEELCGGEVICLSGDLGSGKTTFAQGLLQGLKIKGPYTSPTFSIIKHYRKEFPISPGRTGNYQFPTKSKISSSKKISSEVNRQLLNVFHIDAYRINSKDLLELGFADFAGKKNSITIIEWPEKIKRLIPTSALWINFQWLSDKERKMTLIKK